MTDDSTTSPERWFMNAALYPSFKEIVKALNKDGKRPERKKDDPPGAPPPKRQFPKINKLCANAYSKVMEIYKPKGLTTNKQRGKEQLGYEIINSCRLVEMPS